MIVPKREDALHLKQKGLSDGQAFDDHIQEKINSPA
jgi:hypothetical protein